MNQQVNKIVVVGGGSAGLISALSLKDQLPACEIVIVRSSRIPVIGVGESTTSAVPRFLHRNLRLDHGSFYREVKPSWKLGVRLEWGHPDISHFNYSFDSQFDRIEPGMLRGGAYACIDDFMDVGHYSAMMDRALSPLIRMPNGQVIIGEAHGYHIHNPWFVSYLEGVATGRGISIVDAEVKDVTQLESGNIESIVLTDGHRIHGDLFIDCSGFPSLLLNRRMGVEWISYADSVPCDTAIVGNWQRTDEPILPYTTAQTMDHGWCWRIDFRDHINRGYVFSSKFASVEDAEAEMRRLNPKLEADTNIVQFKCGRHQDFWVGNVAALGNAYGFVEPLESTALQLIIEQARFLAASLYDADSAIVPAMQRVENERARQLWDDVRDFLAVHFKFNRKRTTPFWRHCQDNTNLAGASDIVDYYRQMGPSALSTRLIHQRGVFGYVGYMTLLLGQRVELDYPHRASDTDRAIWHAYRNQVRSEITQSIPMAEAIRMVGSDDWKWA